MNEKLNHIAIVEILNMDSSNLNYKNLHDLVIEYPRLYFDFYILDNFKQMASTYSE